MAKVGAKPGATITLRLVIPGVTRSLRAKAGSKAGGKAGGNRDFEGGNRNGNFISDGKQPLLLCTSCVFGNDEIPEISILFRWSYMYRPL